jgi:hypothetical protein
MSTPAEQRRWADTFRPANPASPQVIWGDQAESLITLRAISFVSPQVASVRFHRTVRQGQQTTDSDWIATIAFAYAKAPMAEADRLRNPLGLQQLVDLNTRDRPGDGRHPRQVLLILDEFARLGHAAVLAHAFAYVAGFGLGLLPVLQSPAQLRAEYGPDLAEEIITNCGVAP